MKVARTWLIVGLTAGLVLAACQHQPQAITLPTLAVLPSLTPIPQPNAVQPTAAANNADPTTIARALSLMEAYQQQNLSFSYPDGWVAAQPAGNELSVMLANNQRVLDAMLSSTSGTFSPQPGDAGVFIFIVPPLIASSGDQPENVLQAFIRTLQDVALSLGQIKRTSIGARPAATMQVTAPEGDGMLITVDSGSGYVALFALAAAGELGQWQATITEIAASMRVSNPPS